MCSFLFRNLELMFQERTDTTRQGAKTWSVPNLTRHKMRRKTCTKSVQISWRPYVEGAPCERCAMNSCCGLHCHLSNKLLTTRISIFPGYNTSNTPFAHPRGLAFFVQGTKFNSQRCPLDHHTRLGRLPRVPTHGRHIRGLNSSTKWECRA